MQKILSAEEMREVDRLTTEKYGIPSILLMENAAHAAARVITEKLGGSVAGKSFLILCGKGSNGGDGAALGRILWTLNATVVVFLCGKLEETNGDAKVNLQILKEISLEKPAHSIYFVDSDDENMEELFHKTLFRSSSRFEVIVDALFGTGLSRPLDEKYQYMIECVSDLQKSNQIAPLVISLDIPSGLSADSNEPIGFNFQADLTVTFTAPKIANVAAPASSFNGELHTADIGSRVIAEKSNSKIFVTQKHLVRSWINQTKFSSASYKNKRGHALLIAGSNKYAGAAVLAGNSAIVSGVGLVTIATARSAQNSIASRVLPEVMTRGAAETENGAIAEDAFTEIDEFIEKSIDAVAIGSGLSSSDESTKKFVKRIVEERRTPIVIDADGLTALAPFELRGSDDLPLILTPHEGEFLKLLGTTDKQSLKDRVSVVRDFAEKHRVILVLKGERTLIGAPDGRVIINPTGNPGLGKAGNGDTLTGIITGFVAQAVQMKVDIFETVVAAVYLAGLAGDIAAEKYGKRSMLASDVRECLSKAFESITN
jgi:hydroxyethylthiazole kinase-like uncharacterized protein yjeF